MFDIAWSEMLVLMVVAIVVIGPKDLPKVMRTMGGWIRKARALASEFRVGMDDLAREADLEDIRKNAVAASKFDPNQTLKKALDPTGELDELLEPPDLKGDLGGTTKSPATKESPATKDDAEKAQGTKAEKKP